MYDFLKDSNGEYVEGYLSSKEDFNGIVFLLKEPNNPNGADEFWFKNMLESSEKYQKETKTSKSIYTKFKIRFSEMIQSIDSKKALTDSIFCNLNPVKGNSKASDDFYTLLENGKAESMLEFFATLKDNIIIFTCKDIYRHLKTSNKISIKKVQSGLKYKKETLECFECEMGQARIVVFEINHPSRSSKIQK